MSTVSGGLSKVFAILRNDGQAYRISHQTFHPLASDPRATYQTLNPHPALSPIPNKADPATTENQIHNEAAYRQLMVQGALAVLLPTEDLENACLRTLVADVIADAILGNSIGGKVSESWFIWSSVSKAVETVKAYIKPKAKGQEIEADSRGRLEKFGLLSDKRDDKKLTRPRKKGRAVLSNVFWRVLQYSYLLLVVIRFSIQGLWVAYHAPPRPSTTSHASSVSPNPRSPNAEARKLVRPILAFRSFALLSSVVNLPQHMPWLFGACSLIQNQLLFGPLRLGATDAILDQ